MEMIEGARFTSHRPTGIDGQGGWKGTDKPKLESLSGAGECPDLKSADVARGHSSSVRPMRPNVGRGFRLRS